MADETEKITDRLRQSIGTDQEPADESADQGKVEGVVDSVKDALTSDSDEKADAEDEGATDLEHQDLLG